MAESIGCFSGELFADDSSPLTATSPPPPLPAPPLPALLERSRRGLCRGVDSSLSFIGVLVSERLVGGLGLASDDDDDAAGGEMWVWDALRFLTSNRRRFLLDVFELASRSWPTLSWAERFRRFIRPRSSRSLSSSSFKIISSSLTDSSASSKSTGPVWFTLATSDSVWISGLAC